MEEAIISCRECCFSLYDQRDPAGNTAGACALNPQWLAINDVDEHFCSYFEPLEEQEEEEGAENETA